MAAIVYFVDFLPNEELELSVFYLFQMGTSGHRRTADLLYYLTAAKYWKDFANIKNNLTLSAEYNKLESSSLKFKKVDKRQYEYSSNSLPKPELKIKVSDGSMAYFFGCSTLKYDAFFISGLVLILAFSALMLHKKTVGNRIV